MGLKDYWEELKKPKEQVEQEKEKNPNGWEICDFCKLPIDPQKIKHFDRKVMHSRCFKKNMKMAMKVYGFK